MRFRRHRNEEPAPTIDAAALHHLAAQLYEVRDQLQGVRHLIDTTQASVAHVGEVAAELVEVTNAALDGGRSAP